MQITAQDVHLLIVEDSEDDALLLLRELRRGGLNPIWERVDSPSGLQHALLQGGWDAVLCDDSLPQINGLTSLAMVRSKYPDLPFFLVSGTLSEELAGSAIDAGVTDSITKGHWARLVPALRRELRVSSERSILRQKEAKVSEERLRLADVIDSANCAIVVIDSELRVAMANSAAERLIGTSRTKMAHQSIGKWLSDLERSDCLGLLSQLLERSEVCVSPDGALGSWQLRPDTGTPTTVEVSFSGLELQGKRHLTLVFREAATRGNWVSALEQGEARFRRLADEALVGIFMTSPEGELRYANRRWCEMSGLSEQEVQGRDWATALHPEDRARFLSDWEEAVRWDREFVADYRLLGSDGTVRFLNGRFVILRDDQGRVSGHLATATVVA